MGTEMLILNEIIDAGVLVRSFGRRRRRLLFLYHFFLFLFLLFVILLHLTFTIQQRKGKRVTCSLSHNTSHNNKIEMTNCQKEISGLLALLFFVYSWWDGWRQIVYHLLFLVFLPFRGALVEVVVAAVVLIDAFVPNQLVASRVLGREGGHLILRTLCEIDCKVVNVFLCSLLS